MNTQEFSAFPVEGLSFLRRLKRNNNREWFQEHKGIYESSLKQPMEAFVLALARDFEGFAPDAVVSPKTSIYRIYRDTRFSPNKEPYKSHIAAIFPRKGLDKHSSASFYVHISATEVFIGGGVYMPSSPDLLSIRQHISVNTTRLRNILHASSFRRTFNGLEGEQLRRVPRAFSSDHPAAPYLVYKQFLAGRQLPSEMAATPVFYRTVLQTFRALAPLVHFLNDPLVAASMRKDRDNALLR